MTYLKSFNIEYLFRMRSITAFLFFLLIPLCSIYPEGPLDTGTQLNQTSNIISSSSQFSTSVSQKSTQSEIPRWLSYLAIFSTLLGLVMALYLSHQTDRNVDKSLTFYREELKQALFHYNEQLQKTLNYNNEMLRATLEKGTSQTSLALGVIKEQTDKVYQTYLTSSQKFADRTESALTKMEQSLQNTHDKVININRSTNDVKRDFANFMQELHVKSGNLKDRKGKSNKQTPELGFSRQPSGTNIKIKAYPKLSAAIDKIVSDGISNPIAHELLRQIWQEQGKYKMADIRQMQYPHYVQAILTYIEFGVLEESNGFVFVNDDYLDISNQLFKSEQ